MEALTIHVLKERIVENIRETCPEKLVLLDSISVEQWEEYLCLIDCYLSGEIAIDGWDSLIVRNLKEVGVEEEAVYVLAWFRDKIDST